MPVYTFPESIPMLDGVSGDYTAEVDDEKIFKPALYLPPKVYLKTPNVPRRHLLAIMLFDPVTVPVPPAHLLTKLSPNNWKAFTNQYLTLRDTYGPLPAPGVRINDLLSGQRLFISERTRNCLLNPKWDERVKLSDGYWTTHHSYEFTTLGDIAKYSQKEVLKIKNLGVRTLSEIRWLLLLFGLDFASSLHVSLKAAQAQPAPPAPPAPPASWTAPPAPPTPVQQAPAPSASNLIGQALSKLSSKLTPTQLKDLETGMTAALKAIAAQGVLPKLLVTGSSNLSNTVASSDGGYSVGTNPHNKPSNQPSDQPSDQSQFQDQDPQGMATAKMLGISYPLLKELIPILDYRLWRALGELCGYLDSYKLELQRKQANEEYRELTAQGAKKPSTRWGDI